MKKQYPFMGESIATAIAICIIFLGSLPNLTSSQHGASQWGLGAVALASFCVDCRGPGEPEMHSGQSDSDFVRKRI